VAVVEYSVSSVHDPGEECESGWELRRSEDETGRGVKLDPTSLGEYVDRCCC
jgi:hypothetical protein